MVSYVLSPASHNNLSCMHAVNFLPCIHERCPYLPSSQIHRYTFCSEQIHPRPPNCPPHMGCIKPIKKNAHRANMNVGPLSPFHHENHRYNILQRSDSPAAPKFSLAHTRGASTPKPKPLLSEPKKKRKNFPKGLRISSSLCFAVACMYVLEYFRWGGEPGD